MRRPELQLKAGRNELLLKLFFAREEDIPHLLPQVEHYATQIRRMLATYTAFEEEPLDEHVPPDARALIGTTIDYGVAAARMQLDWCERTAVKLKELAAPRTL